MIPGPLLRQTIEIQANLGEGAAGPIFGDPTTYRCRLMDTRSWAHAPDSTEAMLADAVAYLRPGAAVAPGDRATCEGVVYRIVAVETARLLVRSSHLALRLSRAE